MRLEQIKLAGFKSFVDPTIVHFPSNLIGIVGPNGCGKSNIIDAVRWVMGESSARQLRGESMADVIFNGSANRKPVSLASVELIFDNSDGRAGGPYAAFRQISVKRQVTRDGQSVYFLNGTRCRRRDIQDLFLGTGLGPRSYAIIEQGMIGRFIEARPEELRLFLEEAAGISRYKERRRETEERMRQTRENLARLDDLRRELGRQLAHLERQAALAERYTRWRAEERRLELELLALRWRALEGERQGLQGRLGELQAELCAVQSGRQALDAEISEQRTAYRKAADLCNALQGQLYAVEAEIARVEQAIRFAKEERLRHQDELGQLAGELAASEQHLEEEGRRLGELDRLIELDGPALELAEAGLKATLDNLQAWESRLLECEAGYERLNRAIAESSEEAQAGRLHLAALEQGLRQGRLDLERIESEWGRLDESGLAGALTDLSRRLAAMDEEIAALGAKQGSALEILEGHEKGLKELGELLDGIRAQIHEQRGRLASLRAFQASALAEEAEGLSTWLKKQDLAGRPRLVETLAVEPGWEGAVESCLGAALKGILVQDLDQALAGASDLPAGLLLIEMNAKGSGSSPAGLGGYLSPSHPAAELIGQVRIVDHWRKGLAERLGLEPGERLVTPEGIEIGRCWIRVPAFAKGGGMIARAEAIAQLERRLAGLIAQESALIAKQHSGEAARTAAQQQRQAIEQELRARERERDQLQAELRLIQTRLEDQAERRRSLAEERLKLEQRLSESRRALDEGQALVDEHLRQLEELRRQREMLDKQRARLRTQVMEGRALERIQRDQVQALRIRLETNRAARAALEDKLAQLKTRCAQLRARWAKTSAALEASDGPLAEQGALLESHRARRQEVEQRLLAAYRERDQLESEIRRLEGRRQQIDQSLQSLQAALEDLRLGYQERLGHQRALEEQLRAAQVQPEAILQGIDPQATEMAWNERLLKLRAQIQALGPVNLAAIDEFKEQSARKGYLDAQYEDIARALQTLEQAIRTIDRETRQRFKETYERVNQALQGLFPRLFGGGQAHLELTSGDLLSSGVAVMARPPGKRNTSIHLLSGGEKALTAIALLFAIFELNPAPFCLLDEVDAPLDEVNVGRFCELLRAMSERVQLIFVTHNKQTMEVAEHLIGVTMHEPGVSRLVSVDIGMALRLAKGSSKAFMQSASGAA